MKLKKTLQDLVRVVAEEAEQNPEFARRIEEAIGLESRAPKMPSPRAANRRAPPVLDPIALARQGEAVLRERLGALTLDQLKDIVADHGMDPGKLVLKWKTPDRVIERIVEVSMGRAKKGEAFLA